MEKSALKILIATRFIHENYGPWIDALTSRGYSVSFINFGKDALSHDLAKVYQVEQNESLSNRALSKLFPKELIKTAPIIQIYNILRGELPDVVIIRELSVGNIVISLLSRIICPKSKIFYYDQKLVSSDHKFRRMARILISKNVFTVCSNNYDKDKKMNGRTNLIPFCSVPEMSRSDIIKRCANTHDRRIKLVSIGKLCFENYNFLSLLEALDSDLLNEFSLKIIGKTRVNLPNYEKAIIQKSVDLNSRGGRIEVLKDLPHKDVKYNLKSSDVFIMPGYNQVASFSQFEAMSYGLPVIICSDNGTAFAIKDGCNGFVVSKDMQSIRESLWKIVEVRDCLDAMSLNSLERLETEFSYDRIAERFENLFDSVI